MCTCLCYNIFTIFCLLWNSCTKISWECNFFNRLFSYFLVLVSLGVALSKLKVFSFKETLIYSLIRILVGPVIGLAFVKYFNLTGVEAGVMFIQASMPSAVLTYLVGKMYYPRKITNSIASTVALSTFLSLFSLVLIVYFALKYFS